MSISETPRTWTLGKWLNGPHRGETMALSGPVPESPIEVVEKAPVDAERERMLDLIEGLLIAFDFELRDSPHADCAEALLREHGRLSEHPSTQEGER